jgi:hypothetical protein
VSGRRYEGLPDVEAELHCAEEPHRIVWRRGRLVLEDHDLLAERSLIAFGSEPPLCVEVLDAWRRLRGPELLADLLAGDTLPGDELAAERLRHRGAVKDALEFIAGPGQTLRGLLVSTRRGIEREREEWAKTLLRALPDAFRRRLALALIVEIERHWHDEAFRAEHREHVEAALARTAGALVERSARCWRRFGLMASIDIESHVLAPGEPPDCTMRCDSRGGAGSVSLPLTWFADVWSRDLALVDDCFVTQCADRAAGAATLPVLALKWEDDARKVSRSVEAPAIVARDDDGAWTLQWI